MAMILDCGKLIGFTGVNAILEKHLVNLNLTLTALLSCITKGNRLGRCGKAAVHADADYRSTETISLVKSVKPKGRFRKKLSQLKIAIFEISDVLITLLCFVFVL